MCKVIGVEVILEEKIVDIEDNTHIKAACSKSSVNGCHEGRRRADKEGAARRWEDSIKWKSLDKRKD